MNSHLLCGFVYGDENGFACKCCDMGFVKLAQLQEHISVTRPTLGAEMLRLPDECLIHIFRCLTPNQLINASRVCRKFKAMVEKEFELHFDPGPIQITTGKIPELKKYDDWQPVIRWRLKEPKTNESGKCRVKCDFVYKSKYQLAFSSWIRRLEIPWPNLNGMGYDKVFQFIRENCSKELISLSFSDYRSPLCGDSFKFERRIYGEIARDHLKHLKHLRVKDVSFQYLYDELLQYTEHLKTLNVIHHCDPYCYLSEFRCTHPYNDCVTHTHPVLQCPHFDSEWTNYTYPELESICVHTSDNQFDLMPMIRRHPKLRSVACNSLATIRSIFQSDVIFNYVAIIFTTGDRYQGVRSLHNDVVKFGQSKRFEKFEVALNGPCPAQIHRIEMIPNLTGLHPDYAILYDRKYTTRLPHIEKLCYINRNTNNREAAEMMRKIDYLFPNLKELRINGHNAWYLQYRYKTCFKQFKHSILCGSQTFKNLKQFHYENDECVELSWDDVVDINFIRSKQPNPFKITFYLDPEHFHRFDRNVVELPFIEVKPWVHGGCQICFQRDNLQ